METELGNEAREYIRNTLLSSNSAAALIARSSNLGSGKIFTFAPPGTDKTRLNEFLHGGIFPGTIAKHIISRGWVVQDINDYLRGGDQTVFILENALAKPTDRWLQNARSKLFFYKDEVYHFLLNGDDTDSIDVAITEAQGSYPPVIGFGAKAADVNLSNRQITLSDLQALTQDVREIVVSAYDGESYIVWKTSHK